MDLKEQKYVIEQLQNMQANGAFDDEGEATKDFSKCTVEELLWYKSEWLNNNAEDSPLEPEIKKVDPNSLSPLEAAAYGMTWQFMAEIFEDHNGDGVSDDVIFFLESLDRSPVLPDNVVALIQSDAWGNEWRAEDGEEALRTFMYDIIRNAESNWDDEPLNNAVDYLIHILDDIGAVSYRRAHNHE